MSDARVKYKRMVMTMKWIKESVKDLKTYPTPRKPIEVKLDSNEGKNICLLDVCESTFLQDLRINLYPDGQSCLLREELGKYLGLPAANIVAGNGSSEMIDLIMKAFVEKGDKVLSVFPSFSMYGVFAKIYSAELVSVESRLDFSLDVNAVIRKAKESAPKAVFLCNPNNPTGYLLEKEEVEAIAKATDALLVLDEAYMEFAYGSLAQDVTAYENLIVLRTMSKAFGLAGLRLGYLASNEGIVEAVNRVRPPYNLNALTQYLGVKALREKEKMFAYVEEVKKEREYLFCGLKRLGINAYPSDANFIFFECHVPNLSKKLEERGVSIRSFSGDLENYYRVTAGNRGENLKFLMSMEEILEDSPR